MKVKRQEKINTRAARVQEIIISCWRGLGATAAGIEELTAIQNAIAEALGEDLVESPAAIARRLADRGVELRHPEVINYDAQWRELRLTNQITEFAKLKILEEIETLTLSAAEEAIAELDRLSARFADSDDADLDNLREWVIDLRRRALIVARDTSRSAAMRTLENEIGEWLRVWLETPNLFSQWLELRKASEAFKTTFQVDD